MAEMGCLRMYMKWGLFDRIPRTQSISFKKLAQEGGIDEERASMLPVQGIEAQLSPKLQSRYILTVMLC
jgi:hypothetical protein